MKNTILFAGWLVLFVAASFASIIAAHRSYTGMLERVATLEARNAELAATCEAQGAALERVRADAAAQADRLARAQAEAAKTRARSEARVQEILVAPAPDDSQELAAWAAKEAKDLSGRLR